MKKKSVTREDKKKAGVLTEDQFFEILAQKSGYMDPTTARAVYRGLVNVVIGELRTKGAVRLPQIADVYLSRTKAMLIKNRFMATAEVKPPSHQVRMVPVHGLKQYFKAIEVFGSEELLDPRERSSLDV